MFQLVGGFLAFLAILSALAGAPLSGTIFALLTLMWVLVAKPTPLRSIKDEAPWGVVYGGRFRR
ncbi:MAG: hypothetical protein ACOY4R_13300 [Pseudomonadota bacterium]